GFYFTSDDHEALIIRPKPIFDGSTPSGNSAAVMTLLRLYAHTSDDRYLKSADMTLCCYASMMERQPFAFAHMLEALDLYERSAQEIVLISEQADAALTLWLRAIGRTYVPGLALSRIAPDEALSNVPEGLRGKTQIDHRLTAYLCRNRACSPPFTTWRSSSKPCTIPKIYPKHCRNQRAQRKAGSARSLNSIRSSSTAGAARAVAR